jgi:hypothetical protein
MKNSTFATLECDSRKFMAPQGGKIKQFNIPALDHPGE